MKSVLSVGFICDFKERSDGCQVEGAPRWISQFANIGGNPIHEFLNEIPPNAKVNIVVTIEALHNIK